HAGNPAAFMGDYEQAWNLARRAIEHAGGDPAVTLAAQGAFGCLLLFSGDSAQGLDLIRPLVNPCKALMSQRPNLLSECARMAYALMFADEFTESDGLFTAVL